MHMEEEESTSIGRLVFRATGALLSLKLMVILICFVALFFVVKLSPEEELYVTTNVSDYGNYIGNRDNFYANKFIGSFFPDKLELSFQEVDYSYRAENWGAYAFEAYLEFTIQDETEFQQHIKQIAEESAWNDFPFDRNYREYVVANDILLVPAEQGDAYSTIASANIGKVLYSQEEHRIIYLAIGVYEGGGASTEHLCRFFDRFRIDPELYALQSKTEKTGAGYLEK